MISEKKREILNQYLGEIEDIPTLPNVVIQLMDKIHEPNPKVDELAELLMTDQVLTTRMIKLVNSVFYGLSREIASVKEAIVYLGLREINNLVYSVSLTNTFERDTPLLQRVRFWEHSFGCALISKLVAQKIGYPYVELAYLAGLLHDIGEAIIALHLTDQFEEVVRLVQQNGKTFYAAEDDILGINHTDFGQWLAETWHLPEIIAQVICYHHNLNDLQKDELLVAIVRLADLICIYHKLDFGYTEGEALTAEIKSTWQFICGHSTKLAEVSAKPFFDEFNEQVDTIKKMVERVYHLDK